jgi:hypothetical protein
VGLHEVRLGGVRAILKGKYLITADDVFEEIMKAKEAAHKRRDKANSISILNEEDLGPENNIKS